MKKIGWILFIIGLLIMFLYIIYTKVLDIKEQNYIDNYISDTSIETDDIEVLQESESLKIKEINSNSNNLNYTAILEIPSINLKRGVVDSTKNFYSINYAISVDKSSNYPNEYGNFILYAHSGNSSIAYFKNLINVNIDDDVYVYFNGIKYHYIIFDKYDIEKNGKAVIKKTINNNYITLITCNQNRDGYQIVLTGKLTDSITY